MLVHSSGSSSRQWRLLTHALEKRGRRCVALDLVGSGANPIWEKPRPVDTEDDLRVILDAIDAEPDPIDLVGHSYGGWLAMRAALARPGRVRQVLVHEPVLWGILFEHGEPAIVDAFRAFGSDGLFDDEVHAGTVAWWHRFIDFWNSPGTWQSLSADVQGQYLRVGWKVFHEVRALIRDETPVATWLQLDCPLRVSVGVDSPIQEREVVRILREHVRNGEVCEVPGGHMAPLTHARPFLRLYEGWLAR